MKKIIALSVITLLIGCTAEENKNENTRSVSLGFDVYQDSGPMAHRLKTDEFASYLQSDNYVIKVNGEIDDAVGVFSLDETITVEVADGYKLYVYSLDEERLIAEDASLVFTVAGEHTVTQGEEESVRLRLTNHDFTLVTVGNDGLESFIVNDQDIPYVDEKWYRHAIVSGNNDGEYEATFTSPNGDVVTKVEKVQPGIHHHYTINVGSDGDLDFDYEEDWIREDVDIDNPWCAYTQVKNATCNGYAIKPIDSYSEFSFNIDFPEDSIAAQSLFESILDFEEELIDFKLTFQDSYSTFTYNSEEQSFYEWWNDHEHFHVNKRLIPFKSSYEDGFMKFVGKMKTGGVGHDEVVRKIELVSNECKVGAALYYNSGSMNIVDCDGHSIKVKTDGDYVYLYFSDLFDEDDEILIKDLLHEPRITFAPGSYDQIWWVEFYYKGQSEHPVRWELERHTWDQFVHVNGAHTIGTWFSLSTHRDQYTNQLTVVMEAPTDPDATIHITGIELNYNK